MVKGWTDSEGELHEKVYEIAWSEIQDRPVDPDVPMTTQERVYTSPIWYIP